jgi:putative ABC transport system permease protein
VLTGETAKALFWKCKPYRADYNSWESGRFYSDRDSGKGLHPSHIRFDLLAAMPLSSDKASVKNWSDEAAAYTYVQLKAGVSKAGLQNILVNATGTANNSLRSSSDKTFAFEAQPLAAISPAMRPMYNILEEPAFPNLLAFALIGFFMLLLAFFNYVNLTLARSLDRAKEVGIRKVSGAVRQQLMMQFLSESLLIAFFRIRAGAGAIIFHQHAADCSKSYGYCLSGCKALDIFILFTLVTGLLAGWIPARVLSSFKPVQVLKGKFNAQLFGGVGLRKTLTVIQFSASLIALITLLVFYQQSLYMAKADYGFNRERMLKHPGAGGCLQQGSKCVGVCSRRRAGRGYIGFVWVFGRR